MYDSIHVGHLPPEAQGRLLESHIPFILRVASAVLGRRVTQSDDFWSVALIAFWEAMECFDPEKGRFETYARLVIRRRLMDELRRQRRYDMECVTAPEVFEGDYPDDALSGVLPARMTLSPETDNALTEELLELKAMLAPYGICFSDLMCCSPKTQRTRAACASAVACLLARPDLATQMRLTRHLPIRAVATATCVPAKVLERHRRYIIAATEILAGDYPCLAGYLRSVWENARFEG